MTTITMLRFLTARDLISVFKRSLPTAKRQVNRFPLPQSGVCVQKVNFFTISPSRKDASLPNPRVSHGPDPIDLDKWKTVMRSKATPEEKIQVDDEGEDEDETEGDLTLEATRELVSMWRLAGKLVPQEITDEELQALAKLTTKSARKKYLKYLAIREGHKKSRKEKQLKKKAYRESLLEQKREVEGEEDDQKVPEIKNSLILQFWNRSLDKVLGWRCAQAMIFGQPLIFDLSYEDNMTKREIENTVSQLMEVEAWNRRASDPYHLHFCNLQPDSYYKEQLIKRYGEETWDRLLITSTEKQHFEVFPREQLVYLTADSPNVLRTYDHSKVYIVGALVDRSIQRGLSLANAKRLKLATARLPLDEFLHWETGAKNLTLDQLIRIMLTIKDTGKWQEALQFVPTRKHDGFHPHQQKGTKHVINKSANFSAKDNIKPALNRPRTLKPKIGKSNQPTRNRNWWDE
ncbi:tRNA methyltransferase 10 homolog C [Boleophthalmus pectinirostris]|uniref:tRNA methyltransferase 10 homolog C n=1 Tax=Boleophthalmus pectinirostris TaxID=150288 RepID=UPI000A1C1CED|nr:tRNA methyltransferase 10 homolog C [Boleophthalmus pectinirostris]